MSDGWLRPIPAASPHSAFFWEGCALGQLRYRRCGVCGHTDSPPLPLCGACQSKDLETCVSSGRGEIYSLSTVWRPQNPAFETPYIVAIVELEEGWRMASNLIECPPERAAIGMKVEVRFKSERDGIALPMFAPAKRQRAARKAKAKT